MKRRSFGRNGTVSAVGFGCTSFGGFYGPTSESETMRALDLGDGFWDTANVYGEGVSETMIGKFLAEDSRGQEPPLENYIGDQVRHSPRPRRLARLRQ
jgi:aryl-alcohol dehydrogenase-like predicted oxidoreductase